MNNLAPLELAICLQAEEREFARCEAIRRAFPDDAAFALRAIVAGWSPEHAREQFQKARPDVA